MARDARAGPGEQLLGNRAGSHACRSFPSARALEDVADVRASVLGHAGEIGVAWTWAGHRRAACAAGLGRGLEADAHRVPPVRPIAILDHHRNRTADRLAGTDAGKHLRAIGFNSHAPSAPVAALPAAQVARDGLSIERESCRDPFEDHHERAPV